jgi:rare lipoprotein A
MISYILSVFLTLFYFGIDQSYNKVGYVQKGTASYYAEDFHGKKTANGEKFNMNTLTAAHPRIRFNSMLKVTNIENGKSVMVRVNDRGPYVGGRILDLSKAAAKQIDMIQNGTASITAEVVSTETLATIEEITKRKEDIKKQTNDKAPIKQETTYTESKTRTKVGSLLDKIKSALLGKKPIKVEKQQEQPKDKTQDQPKDKAQEQPKENVKISKHGEIEEVLPDLKKDKKKNGDKPVKTTPTIDAEVDLPQPKPNNTKVVKTTENENTSSIAVDETKFLALNTYNIWGTEKFPNGHGVQVGSYSDFIKTMEIAKAVHQTGVATVYIQVGMLGDKKVYRILAGEGEVATVRNLVATLQSKGYQGVFVKQHY